MGRAQSDSQKLHQVKGFFYTILCEIKGGHFNKLLPQVPVFQITGESVLSGVLDP